ncbi:MAG: DUF4445 domain-containing protein, partial [Gammaproteobacteria bacterium]|nr:DUF4445 domain-containing protein [Gammaproteobacteria bacterium]
NISSPQIITDGNVFSYKLYSGKVDIVIRQSDIRAIQLAKAALYAGVKLLMEIFGVNKVDRIRLAGAFGAHIDVKYAMILGLIPDCNLSMVSSAGNAAGTGARICLLDKSSRNIVESEVAKIEKIETASEENFQQHFVAAMSIPHESDIFENLAKEVVLPVQIKKTIKRNKRRRRKHP